jgi:hypothetical protein
MERPVSQKKFPPPLLIVGSPRSGTTLFSQILNNHSRIAIYHETHYTVRLVDAAEYLCHRKPFPERIHDIRRR